MSKKNHKIAAIITGIVFAIIIIIIAILLSFFLTGKKDNKIKLSERGLPIYSKPLKKSVENADYYISIKTGNDDNQGTKEKPFKSIEKAQNVIRNLIKTNDKKADKNIIVAIMGGEYNLKSSLDFSEKDNLLNNHKLTYTSYNNEEVIISGGINLKAEDFKELTPEDLERLSDNAKANVKVVNLFEKGLTSADIGKLYAIGGFSQGKKYGEGNGSAVEVFYKGNRMSIARYPNDSFKKIGDVIDFGEASEHVPDIINWDATPSPRPPKFLTDDDMKERIQRWKKPTNPLNQIWAYGYFYWDWADVSSPIIDFDKTNGQLDLKYSSPYGIKKDGLYYAYNVFEELDTFNEYYIDRETGNFYVYFPDNKKESDIISISLLEKRVISFNKSNNLILDGLTIECCKQKGLDINANNTIIKNMIIRNVGTEGIKVEGINNQVLDCEIKNVGKSGILVGRYLNYVEGNIENDIRKNKLIIENNIIKNNYIHNYGELSKSQIAGVYVWGVGNKVLHNEIFDSPYTAIFYVGNEHLIEYNYIHHVVKQSSDAGAIYSGRNLSFFGNIIRYNLITDIGSEHFTPNGIYFDDCLAGQLAYGNILANIPGSGFLIGGGREHKIYDNIIINVKLPIHYDARAYDGLNGGWYKKNVITENGRQWKLLSDAKKLYDNWLKDPKTLEIIKKSEADYSKINTMLGFENRFDTNSAATPNSSLYNNIIISNNKEIGKISEISKKYSSITNNNIYDIRNDKVISSFKNFKKGNYTITKNSLLAKENKNYQNIKIKKIGRINN